MMAEDEKKKQEETAEPEATEEDAPKADDAPEGSAAPESEAEEPAAEEASDGEAAGEPAEGEAAKEPAEGEAGGASDEVAEAAVEPAATPEPEPAGNGAEGQASGGGVPEASGGEVLSPKELRKRRRARASGPARASRSPEERAAERIERRGAAAEGRRRHRAARRSKRGEPGSGTAPAEREAGARKVRQGSVVSTGGDKTITVEIAIVRRHPTYEKVVRRTSRLRAHDESNEAGEGDVVRVVECRPISRTKRWRLVEILERAPR
jgi:small subunit ribosomal protein S17